MEQLNNNLPKKRGRPKKIQQPITQLGNDSVQIDVVEKQPAQRSLPSESAPVESQVTSVGSQPMVAPVAPSDPTPNGLESQVAPVKKTKKNKRGAIKQDEDETIKNELNKIKEKELKELQELEKNLYLEKLKSVIDGDTKLKQIREIKKSLENKVNKEKEKSKQRQVEIEETIIPIPEPPTPKKQQKKKVVVAQESSPKIVNEVRQNTTRQSAPLALSKKDLMREYGF